MNIGERRGHKNIVIWVVVIIIAVAALGYLAFILIFPGMLIMKAPAVASISTLLPSSPNVTPAITPSDIGIQGSLLPTPNSSPVPVADPNDIYFTPSENINIKADLTEWTYSSNDLYIHIQKYDNIDQKLHYFIADIRTSGNEILKSGFSNPQKPGATALLPSLVARKLHAVYLQNGDYFEDKRSSRGVVIRAGKVYRDDTKADTLAIMPDGTLKVYSGGEINAAGLLKLGVSDSFSFGPILIKDGIINPNLSKAHVSRANPRSGIGMIDKGHFIAIVVEGRNPQDNRGVTLEEYAKMFADQGCTVAYNLDGGASSAMVFMGETLNLPTNVLTTKTYRRVPDVLMIGISDAVPVGN